MHIVLTTTLMVLNTSKQEVGKRDGCRALTLFRSLLTRSRVFFWGAGEKLIQLASDSLVTEILIHPQLGTLKQCMRNLLSSFTRHRHIVHAGYTLSGSGSWILQVRESPLYSLYI